MIDDDDDDDEPVFDEIEPDEIDIEAIDAFHLGGDRFAVSVQLSDQYDEVARSYLLELTVGKQVKSKVLLQIEDLILSHASIAADWHVALEVGGVTHHLRNRRQKIGQGPEPFTNKLWHLDPETIFLYGEAGTTCLARDNEWIEIPPATPAFLRTMHGPSRNLIHVGGDDGALLRLSGDAWTPIPLGFNRSISALNVSASGEVFFGCEDGYCARYADEELTDIAGPGTQIFSICEFRGERYWCDDEYGLFIQKGSRLERFKPLGYIYNMHSTSDFLVTAAWRYVFIFDGERWAGVELGYDGDLFVRSVDMTRNFT
ncbi:hypothetical protein [Mesorhizobium abyssinicae]|uniref:hypothetical protein n=1 Tax=Mesorhizobium abyssinicae TaxID=1209958 RepID=UPI00339492A9